ncbi:MAG: protein-glutamate O-methyltransferase CheR [Candidatus Ozemobacteraceae bacterium]
MSEILLSPDELQLWTRFIQELSGISLDENKAYLIKERLGSLLSTTGSSSFSQLYFQAKNPESQSLRIQIVDAIATHETYFFRDGFPFEALQLEIIPAILKQRKENPRKKNVLRIWSAGCSTGQELFSIAMILAELNVDAMNIEVELLGTDISESAILKAQTGVFSRFEIERGLSPERRNRFFSKSDADWKIDASLMRRITFRQMNLLQPFCFPEKMDIIFCRNVAIYFQPKDKQKIFSQLAKTLADDGFLLIGTTENARCQPGFFRESKVGRAIFYQPLKSPGYVEKI